MPLSNAISTFRVFHFLGLLFFFLGCERCEQHEWTSASRPRDEQSPSTPPESISPEQVYAPVSNPVARENAPRILPAFVEDPLFASSSEQERARRIVYRVSLRVPRSLGDSIASPSGELYIDLSQDRLRARFSGRGWPIHDGSEVRLRRDEPGVYIFDGLGGRPLGPGQLAQWFEGGRLRFEPSLRIRSPPAREQVGLGNLLCRFISEWTNTPPDDTERRCGEGGSPPDFRVGRWRAQRTADTAIELPRSSLRADHHNPPQIIPSYDSHIFLTPELMRRIPARRGPRSDPDPNAPEEGLTITNRGRSRVIVTVQGVAVGWINQGKTAHLRGLESGTYEVGAIRPFGLQFAGRQHVAVPAHILLPRWVPRTQTE